MQYVPIVVIFLISLAIIGQAVFFIAGALIAISTVTLFLAKKKGMQPASFYAYIFRFSILWIASFSIATFSFSTSSNFRFVFLIFNIIPFSFIFVYYFKASFFVSKNPGESVYKEPERQSEQKAQNSGRGSVNVEKIIDKLDNF